MRNDSYFSDYVLTLPNLYFQLKLLSWDTELYIQRFSGHLNLENSEITLTLIQNWAHHLYPQIYSSIFFFWGPPHPLQRFNWKLGNLLFLVLPPHNQSQNPTVLIASLSLESVSSYFSFCYLGSGLHGPSHDFYSSPLIAISSSSQMHSPHYWQLLHFEWKYEFVVSLIKDILWVPIRQRGNLEL